jgi:ribonuclease P protein component
LNYNFPKSSRLLKKSEFQRVYHKGTKLFGNHILIYANPSCSTPNRLGISVPKKFGKSHDRNFFKRVIRELFRTSDFKGKSFDFHVLPKAPIQTTNFHLLKEEYISLLEKLLSIHYDPHV